MLKDPIVEDIRKVRKQLEKKYGTDQDAYLNHIYNQETKSKGRLFSRSPKKRFSIKAA